MVTIYRARDLQEAYLIRGLLQQQGINAQVSGEYLSGGIGELPAGDLVRVRVPQQHTAIARRILALYENGTEHISEGELEALAMSEAEPLSTYPLERRYPGWPLFLAIVALLSLALILTAR